MTNFAILRVEKLKTMGNISASLQHNFRERDTPNADPSKTPSNLLLNAQNTQEAMDALDNRLKGLKVRKNAVLAIEYLMTASPEYWVGLSDKRKKEFFKVSLDFLKEKHGEENIICATVHLDETSPHLAAYIVPIDQRGKLNASAFLDGREKMQKLQDDFSKKVWGLGLERGIRGSKAKHERVQRYYGVLNRTQLRKTGIFEAVYNQVISDFDTQNQIAVINAEKARKANMVKLQKELEESKKTVESRVDRLEEENNSLRKELTKSKSNIDFFVERAIAPLNKKINELETAAKYREERLESSIRYYQKLEKELEQYKSKFDRGDDYDFSP